MRYKYKAKVDNPIAGPINDTINKNFLPNLSENCVEHKLPRICITANIIAATNGLIKVPAFSKISTA